MEKAAELLEATTLKVIEIATAVGYENQGQFAKVFSEVYGMTPLEYRRWARQGMGKNIDEGVENVVEWEKSVCSNRGW